jgi:nucleotide-binding universal stress UspA family protein
MSIKSILCIFDGTPDQLRSLNIAMVLAKSCTAYLRILHITQPITAELGGIIANGAITDAMEKDNDERLKKAKEYTRHYSALHHIPLHVFDTPHHHALGKFTHRTGTIEKVVAEEGRMSDLLVIGRNNSEISLIYDSAVMTALFDTGRPTLVASRSQGSLPMEWEIKTISLPWNGSLEAARALYNTIPFLEKAEKVHVLIAGGPNESSQSGEESPILEYLQAHGVIADIVSIDCHHRSTGEALLAKAHDLKSDVIVMGAYGHTRTREIILGGVTNYMLTKADIPLLLSH